MVCCCALASAWMLSRSGLATSFLGVRVRLNSNRGKEREGEVLRPLKQRRPLFVSTSRLFLCLVLRILCRLCACCWAAGVPVLWRRPSLTSSPQGSEKCRYGAALHGMAYAVQAFEGKC